MRVLAIMIVFAELTTEATTIRPAMTEAQVMTTTIKVTLVRIAKGHLRQAARVFRKQKRRSLLVIVPVTIACTINTRRGNRKSERIGNGSGIGSESALDEFARLRVHEIHVASAHATGQQDAIRIFYIVGKTRARTCLHHVVARMFRIPDPR